MQNMAISRCFFCTTATIGTAIQDLDVSRVKGGVIYGDKDSNL